VQAAGAAPGAAEPGSHVQATRAGRVGKPRAGRASRPHRRGERAREGEGHAEPGTGAARYAPRRGRWPRTRAAPRASRVPADFLSRVMDAGPSSRPRRATSRLAAREGNRGREGEGGERRGSPRDKGRADGHDNGGSVKPSEVEEREGRAAWGERENVRRVEEVNRGMGRGLTGGAHHQAAAAA
jgi:hypothetical protein